MFEKEKGLDRRRSYELLEDLVVELRGYLLGFSLQLPLLPVLVTFSISEIRVPVAALSSPPYQRDSTLRVTL